MSLHFERSTGRGNDRECRAPSPQSLAEKGWGELRGGWFILNHLASIRDSVLKRFQKRMERDGLAHFSSAGQRFDLFNTG
jgi:hypothetical protein